MKNLIIILCLLLLNTVNAFSQTENLTKVELISTNSNFSVYSPEILGIDNSSMPKQLVYRFVHPNGGIQSIRGSLMSGGKKSETLQAYGLVDIGEHFNAKSNTVQWYTSKRASTSVNFFAKPLTSITNMSDENMIAGKGSIISNKAFQEKARGLKDSSPLFRFPVKEEKENKEPFYVKSYKITTARFGLSGKISSISILDYTLKPKEERFKGLFGTAYEMEAKKSKANTKMVFGDKTISYTFLSGIEQLNDPVTGNLVVFGGMKYRKNKAKKTSRYYEFVLLTYDHKGGVLNKVNYNTEVPLSINEMYPIYGKNLAPRIDETTHAIFIMQGDGNKKIPNINRKLRRVIVADVKTGEIIKEDEIEFKHGNAKIIRSRYLAENKIELTFFYTSKSVPGMTIMVISPEGIISVKEIDSNNPAFKKIGLEQKSYTNLKIEVVKTYSSNDGSRIDIVEFVSITKDLQTKKEIRKSEGTALMKYDAADNFVKMQGFGHLYNVHNVKVLDKKDGKLWLMAFDEMGLGLSKLTFIKVNVADLELEVASITNNGKIDYFYDATSAMVYALTQKKKGKGLSVSVYKM